MTSAKTSYFDRSTTSLLKGMALVFMFIHHFFTFPSWWVKGVSYPTVAKLAPYFNMPFKICVPMFCFITGYAYYFNSDKSFRYSIKKITDLLIYYWGVFFTFAIIAIACVKYKYTPITFIREMFALSRPTMIFAGMYFFTIYLC